MRRVRPLQRVAAGLTAGALAVSQLVMPTRAEASHLGSATASAGSAPPPSVSAVQSFQPDLFTGRATTAIPIAVPPGRKGMQPSLALAYSSSGRNGWLGVGWALDVGYIERSTKNGVPKYDASDAYTFLFQGVGSDLVHIGGTEYRAKDEGLFLKFSRTGAGWEVRDKSGTQYLFGQTPGSRIEDAGKIFRWALEQVIDPHGNTLTVTYTSDQGQLYPDRIDYTGHAPTSLAPANKVEFILEDRPDDDVSYRSGFAVTTAKRLKEIKTSAKMQGQFQPARKYVLTYATSARTSRSLLRSVQQFGTDGATSLPATTFTYQDTGSATYPNVLSNIVPPPSVAAWNVRKAGQDTGHETWGCAFPYMGLPWGSPSVASGGFDVGCVSGSVSGNGDVTMSGCNDHFGHLWTYVYLSQAKTISLARTNGNDAVACLYKEEAGGVVTPITDSGSISLAAGWSILHLTSYHQHQGWGPATISGGLKGQVEVMNPSQIALGVPQLAGDVNGDAKTDIIKFNPASGSWTVSCATSCTLSPGGAWISGFGNSSSTPLLGDWNGDGKTDIAIFNGGNWQFARSIGSGFVAEPSWNFSLGSGTPLTGDFNGDGNTDIGTYDNGSWSAALWHDSGFSTTGSLSWGDSNYEALTGDFNGDGLTDIGLVNKSSGAIDVRLSTGGTWAGATNWIGGFGGANPHTSADFNGDGLTDAVYYNRPTGQVIYAPSTGGGFGASVTLPLAFSLTSPTDQIQVGDFNGDGIADPAAFNLLSGSSQLALSSLTNGDGSNGTATDVLRAIANGVGGATTLTYQPSSLCGCDEESILPFVLPVVQQATQADGMGHTYTTTYLFHGGLYDAPSKEFRGFARATVFDVAGNKSITEFHQDPHKKGRPFRTEFRDQHDTLWTTAEQTWSCVEPFPGVHFAKLDQTDGFVYDGDATFRQVSARFTYDAYGNLTRAEENGDVSIFGDERATVATFAYNPDAWILNKPAQVQTLDATGTVVAQRRFFYDGAASPETPPVVGALTKEEEWLNLPAEQWLATSLTYDAYGNVKTVTDALSRTTTNTYDPETHTYLTTIANILGHTRTLAYDPRFGQVTSSIDQNGVPTTTELDALGRVTKVIGPTDKAELPTVRYEYDPCLATPACSPPIRSTVHTRIQSGQAAELTVHAFVDGLGRTIQTRAPAEDQAKHVVTGAVEFDTRGQVIKQWAPYLSNFSSSYVPLNLEPPTLNLVAVSYTYDALGRLTKTTDPDGTATVVDYDDGRTTTSVAGLLQTEQLADAYGRLVQVVEVASESERYTTGYIYDTLGNLLQVVDAKGNTTALTYDSLGRKHRMDDPDMGRWTYAYDAVDNLTSQTDARGVVMTFTYDALNRLTRKDYTVPPASGIQLPASVVYTYDDPAVPLSKGKLTKVVDGSGSSSFEYDLLGRLVKESKTVDGTTSTIQRSYDLLGRLTSLTYPNSDVGSYTYNPQGGLETVSLQSPVFGLRSAVSDVNYNAAGQVTQLVYGNGVTTTYDYDPTTLRLASLVTRHPSLATLQDFSYAFDPLGNVAAITDRVHTGSQTFAYDRLSRLTRAVGAYGDRQYAYDPLGNLTEKDGATLTYPAAGVPRPHAVSGLQSPVSSLSFTYDANGNVVEKTATAYCLRADEPASCLAAQRFQYDAENRLVEVATAPEETVSVTFQPGWNFFALPVIPEDGAVITLLPSFAQDFAQIAKFEPASGAFSHYVGNPKFNDFSSLEYGVGYQVYCKASSPVTVSFTGKLPTKQLSKGVPVGWDLLPALGLSPQPVAQAFAGVDVAEARAYNPADGSLTSPAEVQPGAAYYVRARTASTFRPALPRDPTTRFVYDGDGGRVKQITAQGTTRFLGELIEQAPDGTTTTYVFAGSQRIAAMETPPGQQAQLPPPAPRAWARLWHRVLDFLDLPSAEAAELPATIRFYHGDHLGSSNLVTDGTGAVIEHTEHRPYGAIHRHEGPKTSPHQFTGQRQDGVNGLILFPARAYDPALGRFLQPDPFVQDPSDPQTLNRYAYVRNNPINLVDPSGYGWFRWVARIVGAIIGAFIGASEGPGGVVVGAIVGYYIGDSIGAAIEGRREGSAAPALPADTGQRFWQALTGALQVVNHFHQQIGQLGQWMTTTLQASTEAAQSEAYRNLVLIGTAPMAALVHLHQMTEASLLAVGQTAGAVVSALPEGSGAIVRSLALNALSDRSSPTARWRLKIGHDLKVTLGAVKRIGNNKFLIPGSRAFGTPAKSFTAPVFKGIGRAFGVASLASHAREFASEPLSIMSFRSGALSLADAAGLASGLHPLLSPLRLVPALAGAVDIGSQKAVESWYGILNE